MTEHDNDKKDKNDKKNKDDKKTKTYIASSCRWNI